MVAVGDQHVVGADRGADGGDGEQRVAERHGVGRRAGHRARRHPGSDEGGAGQGRRPGRATTQPGDGRVQG